ncbi:MAG: c-type cytochrome [Rubripirellula sp.]|nr:c-type cytochrome [Rubripirellula sp.]
MNVTAQTLSESLIQEGAAPLAVAAREQGDAVRGAILFSQQKLNCVKCHQSGAVDLLGPDLTLLDQSVTDSYIVESLLMPSKVIKKGYEGVKLLTVGGVVVVGRVVQEDANAMVVRDNTDGSRKIRLQKAEIDRIEPSDVSTMPADLANQLESRQQFLDLCKYLMDLAATNPTEQMASNRESGIEMSDRLQGLALLDQFRCAHCHDGLSGNAVPAALAPNLDFVTSRIDPTYLKRFVSDPQKIKPGTSMPHVLGHLDDATREETVTAIIAYLRSRSEAVFHREPIDDATAQRGKEMFHRIGCVACHSPRDEDGKETLPENSVSLGDLSGKYGLRSLTEFLENPHIARPAGRMPDMNLTHWEAVDLASYLIGPTGDGEEFVTEKPPADLIHQGQKLYQSVGCANCHETGSARPVPNPPIALTNVESRLGCLSTDPKRKIRYELDASKRKKLIAAIESQNEDLERTEQLQVAMLTLRCYQCHQRDGIGGVSADRDLYFHSDDPNLGPQGRIPPTLSHVGAKLQPKWMRQVMVSGRAIRPYVQTRMPQYGTANVEPLIEMFQQFDELPTRQWIDVADPKEAKKVGTDLVGSNGLNCVACHTFQQKPAQTMPAVDLTEMAERLKRDWFEIYMRDPPSLSPGTVMPSFWPGGKSIRPEILNGNTDQQIATLWLYLQDGRQARQPRGLVIEPMELLASREAVMLRRNYQGIGKRGIGVGYPGQLNLAFDAEQLRLALLWEGKFADPGAAWRGQGAGTVRPLSREVIQFPSGPDLDEAANPWVVDEGRPPRHHFKGYRLDDLQRPTFRYEFDQIRVSDYAIDLVDESTASTVLKRQVQFETEKTRDGLVFRIAGGQSIEKINESLFRLNSGLRIRIDDRHRAETTGDGDSSRLFIPLQLPAGVSTLEIDYIW